MMLSKTGIVAVAAIVIFAFVGFAIASPPVPPPAEGFGITTSVDVEMSSGDFSEVESLVWTYTKDYKADGERDSTLDGQMNLGINSRIAEVRYTEELGAIDSAYFQFNKGFTAKSDAETSPNVKVSKDYAYVASGDSLIAIAQNKERAGLSIVATGDSEGLNDMPSLCPWVSGTTIPATNEFIAMGSNTSTTNVMVSHTDTEITSTEAPVIDHVINAVGVGSAKALMKVRLMEGDGAVLPTGTIPNLISKTAYDETTKASGVIDKFNKSMHYHSTIPAYQMPEPWYAIQ